MALGMLATFVVLLRHKGIGEQMSDRMSSGCELEGWGGERGWGGMGKRGGGEPGKEERLNKGHEHKKGRRAQGQASGRRKTSL